MATVNILSGGAAQGLIKSLASAFKAASGLDSKENSARSESWQTNCAPAAQRISSF